MCEDQQKMNKHQTKELAQSIEVDDYSTSKDTNYEEISIKLPKEIVQAVNDSYLWFNYRTFSDSPKFHKMIIELHNLCEMFRDYATLSYGGNFLCLGKTPVFVNDYLRSANITLESMILCCSVGSFADANTLLRKFMNDLFFFLYLLIYQNEKERQSCNVRKMEKHIAEWMQDSLSNLYIGEVLKTIAEVGDLEEVIGKYKLHDSFNRINQRLNNYVHGNGISYSNELVAFDPQKNLSILANLIDDIKYIMTTFFFLNVLRLPASIMSTDYVDYLDSNLTPPDKSQYSVAPFVLDFIRENKSLIGDDCLSYLQSNSVMNIPD